ncbi:hypothetical protein QQS21_008172 [Conoideocrella luteorostrata]|uniref:Rab-GAP TBC domain-containing protein n=1 Tax=Conoideocrella luteorostrata TaxID=1105319 RepID=A0AAJ0FRP1_9HYPO|nr:hypothetical protein QQS21_008172 [Conoideocrella luteorostrata]
MISLEETQSRWRTTQDHCASLDELRRAVKYNGSSSPCLSGCRSVCWKIFLLSPKESETSWMQALEDGRRDYQERRNHFLRYIQHPEALAELTVDPLADDPESPWNTVRQDEIIRAEIQQDVQRLPDEVNYHEQGIQGVILDILFVYCKANPERGGYRQGMHELLAPMVYTLEQDSVDRGSLGDSPSLDQAMLGVLDSAFLEHDAYILFSRLMEHAQSFYKVADRSSPSRHATSPVVLQEQRSAIVDRSKYIHEVCLQKVDPELATHLTNIEILPQIFLIRWIRLLFSREFPFHQLLVLWDTMFAVDPSLELIDLICVAMLIRIRWQLLEADYSVCLQLLLKYPGPEQPHGPHTFIDDASYLRNHLDAAGGASLIMKYSGKMPEDSGNARPNSIRTGGRGAVSVRQGVTGGRSSFSSPPRYKQQQPSMETFLQGAAKGANRVLERSERLGINQAVRDAMGEIRRNVQSFNEARQAQRPPRSVLSEEGAAKALAAMERRNKQLASLLNDTVTNLKTVTMLASEDRAKSLELIEVAAAKIQFVQIYLEDSTMDVPVMSPPQADAAMSSANQENEPEKSVDDTAVTSPNGGSGPKAKSVQPAPPDIAALSINEEKSASKRENSASAPDADKMDTSGGGDEQSEPAQAQAQAQAQEQQPSQRLDPLVGSAAPEKRPGPVPTRSTLAQSSFSWMLEPDESSSSRQSSGTGTGPKSPPPSQHKKRASTNMSRERTAFLFGEVTAEADGTAQLKSDDIFGMEPLSKKKDKSPGALFDEQ